MADKGENRQSIGERLLALRNKNNLTQEELAERLMVSRQSVSKWELGKTLPDVEKLIQLSEMYQVSMDYLIIGKKDAGDENGQEGALAPEDIAEGTEGSGQGSFSLQSSIDGQDVPFQKEEKKNSVDRVIQRSSLLLCIFLSGFLCIVFAGETVKFQVPEGFFSTGTYENNSYRTETFQNKDFLTVDCSLWSTKTEGDYPNAKRFINTMLDFEHDSVKEGQKAERVQMAGNTVYYIDLHYTYAGIDYRDLYAACDYGRTGIFAVKATALDSRDDLSMETIRAFFNIEKE